MKKFKRRSFTGSASRLEQQEEAPPLDKQKDPAENMRELLTEITRKEQMATGKRMGYLENFVQLVRCLAPSTDFGLSLKQIVMCLKVAFVSPAKEIRAASLRALRHLLQTPEQAKIVIKQRMDIFVSRSMDLQPAMEVERVQALKLVRKMIYLCPEEFPMSLAMSLAAISADMSQNRDRMSRACLATLCELAIKNIKIASYCGAVNVIISNILDCPIPRMNESLIVTLLYLFNTPRNRCYVRRSVGLEAILAPFTDLYYRHNSDIPDNAIIEDQKGRIEAAKLALVTIFRSWPGIICMCDAEGNGLESLMGVFRLPNADVRAGIIETLFQVFCLRMPVLTDDFIEALNSCDPSHIQYTWKLCEGFIVEEALSLLKHRASGNRTNLVQSYVALVLNAFIDADLLESLVEVITTSDDKLSIRATILLGELLHMANTLLPPECSGSCSGHTHCLPTLMSLATNLEVSSSKRGKASAAIGYLDQIHQVKKRGTIPCSLFLEQILSQANNPQGKSSKSSKEKSDQTILRDSEDILSAIKESQVLSVNEFLAEWDWDLISAVLDSPKLSIKRQEDPTHIKFVRRLLQFYKPSNKQYCLIEVGNTSARKLSEVGLELIDFLLRREEQPDGKRLLLELVQEISDGLTEATSTGHMMGVFCSSSINDTLARDYFLFIGRLSSTHLGTRCLERSSGVFQHLLEICSMKEREKMLKLILASFDYGKDGIARVILAKALTAAPLASSRLYATRFMRVLLRAKTQYFSNWGMELLTNQLYDQASEVVAEAIDVLQEACEDEANLQRLIEIRPALLHLGEKGVILLVRYLSVSRGFTYLSEVDYVEPLLKVWKLSYNLEYVHWIENELGEALTLFQKLADNDNYIRRSLNDRLSNKDVFVIPHLYGELAQHRMGIKLIQDKGFLKDSINTILYHSLETAKDILNMKAALWALGHIGSTSWGVALINPVPRLTTPTDTNFDDDDSVLEDDYIDIIKEVVQLAQECEVLTVRGTCFYVLGLIAKTSQGADRLEELGWECVRHRGAETWPVIEQEVAYLADDYKSEEECVGSESGDEADENQNGANSTLANDRYGGVYMGDEVSDFCEPYHTEAFEYTRITLGEDRKGKGKKRSPEDEKLTEQDEKRANSDFKTRTFNIDDSGNFTEQSVSLMSGLERIVGSGTTASIYLGGEDTAVFSKQDSRENLMQTLANLEKQQSSRTSNSEPNLSMFSKSTPKKNGIDIREATKETRSVFGEGGIYLGEEEIEEEPRNEREELLFGSKWFAPKSQDEREPPQKENPQGSARPQRFEKMFSSELQLDNLRPIREVDSKENIPDNLKSPTKDEVDGSIAQTVNKSSFIDIQGQNGRERNGNERESFSMQPDSYTSQYSSLPSENSSSRQSPIDFRRSSSLEINGNDDKRGRSLSLPARKDSLTSTPGSRSASFSGVPQNIPALLHGRSESDPGMSGDSHAESFSSQDSEKERLAGRRVRSGVKSKEASVINERRIMFPDPTSKLGLRERSDSDERRSKNYLLDVSTASRKVRRPRGNTFTLSVSPASFRVGSVSSYCESPVVASARDGLGYAAWTTLRKQRTFRKEIDLKIQQSSAVSPYRQIMERRNHRRGYSSSFSTTDFPRINHHVSIPSSLSQLPYIVTRRHFSNTTSISSTGSENFPATTTAEPAVNTDDYVGRCIPIQLYDILRLNAYEYKGSWAANFDQEEEDCGKITGEDFPHLESRCLHCLTLSRSSSRNSVKSWKTLKEKDERKNSNNLRDRSENEFPKKKFSASSLPQIDPQSEDRILVHKEVLRLIVNLSSSVASKASQQGLITLKDQYPWAFEDLCLYSQMMDQLGMYTFRLSMRRFIQAMFENINYVSVFHQADAILGRTGDR